MNPSPILLQVSPVTRGAHLRLGLLLLGALASVGGVCHEQPGQQTFASPQSNPIVVSPDGSRVYVAQTTRGVVRGIDTSTHLLVSTTSVGMEPVSLALKPDGSELWVSNHVSDSVSVIDTQPGSTSRDLVIETIQWLDPDGVTRFDEPVGIAFASNAKAYVALSSRDQVAVIDTGDYSVTSAFDVNAQEPRALRVRGGRLYVLPFESGNQTELSTCPSQVFPIDPSPGSQCTFDQADHNFAQNPQLVGAVVDLVIDPDVPDRDLYVYDTADESPVDVVSGVSTLLYGLAVDGNGRVFVSAADARNAANGQAGTSGDHLHDLQNRLFLNHLVRVDCSETSCGAPTSIDVEEPVGQVVTTPLATPYGIEISDDDSTLIVTAAASSRIFSFDATATGMNGILDTLDVGAIPRGVALHSNPITGAPEKAYVLNTLGNSVTVVDVSDPSNLVVEATVALPGDWTPEQVRLGRIAFNDASASTSGTFSCASCHPDAHTDQLLWNIGARCTFEDCDQEELRSTMPVRGLRDTLPLHWDGVLGDPFGGTNGEVATGIFGSDVVAPNCGPNGGGLDCFRHLVNASLGGVMCDQAGCPTNVNELGHPGNLSEGDRDAMAVFLENVSYPPARSRRPDDSLSASARDGFEDFFIDQGGIGLGPETCADPNGGCHALPFGAGTNSPFVGGFDAPTMRGITDRWLQFSVGITNVQEQLILTGVANLIDPPFWSPAVGFDELINWKLAFGSAANPGAFRSVYNVGPFDIFQMIEEASTGHSGALGRQVTLNTRTTQGSARAETEAILALLEAADAKGVANVRGPALRAGALATFSLVGSLYKTGEEALTRAELLAEAQSGTTLLTLTAHLRGNSGAEGFEPPALAVPSVGPNILTQGSPDLPSLPDDNPMNVQGLHVHGTSTLVVDGAVVSGTISCLTGAFAPSCPADPLNPNQRNLEILLDQVPASGTHVIQVVSPKGMLSNELPFTVD